MNIIITLIFVIQISAFRLLTLDKLGEKHKNIFIANINSKPKLMRIKTENISNFYVVVHSKKVFFYSKGIYHTFSYDIDNVKLKLSPVEIGKVQYYTQDMEDNSSRAGISRTISQFGNPEHKKMRGIKVMKWDELIKKPASITKVTESKKVETIDSFNRRKVRKIPSSVLSVMRNPTELSEEGTEKMKDNDEVMAPEDENEGTPSFEYVPEKNNNGINDEKINYKNAIKNLYELIKNPKKENQKFPPKHRGDIESDSEMTGPKSLNISIEVVNGDKAFVLKNDKNLCVTYFQKSFLLAECTNSKRQLFKLVKADEVINKLHKKVKGSLPKQQEDELIEEITTSSNNKEINEKEDHSSDIEGPEDIKEDKKPQKKKRKEKPVKKKPKADIKKLPKKHEDAKPKEQEKPPVPIPKPSDNQNNRRIPPNQNNFKKIIHKTTISRKPVEAPLPPNFEKYCRDVLNQNGGRFDLLPPGCDKVLGFGRYSYAPPPAQQPPQGIKAPLGITIQATTVTQPLNTPEVKEENNTGQSNNLIERLERELMR